VLFLFSLASGIGDGVWSADKLINETESSGEKIYFAGFESSGRRNQTTLGRVAPQEQRIVRMRLGVDSEVYSVKEVAQLLRIAEGEVSAVEDKFLGKLRQT
jgi:DNA-directed RNA polymerase sigma subunit (sigma70/sigma32)